MYIMEPSLELQASVTHEAIYWLPSMKDIVCINVVSFNVTASPFAMLQL